MLFLKKHYPEIVEDILTQLTGGIVDESHSYSSTQQEYPLKYTEVKNVVSMAGQVNDMSYSFKEGVDWRLIGDKIIWQEKGTKPDINTTFLVSYFHKASSSPITDKNIGSVSRTMVEAFSREVAVLYAQLMCVYDTAFVDTASSKALDNVVALLGMSRKKTQASKGYVVFGRKSPPEKEIIIPKGTKVATATEPKIEFITTEEGKLDDSCLNPNISATWEVSIPVEAVKTGEEGNVEPGTITVMPNPPAKIEYVINPSIIAKKIEFIFKLGQEEYEIDDTVYLIAEVTSDKTSFKPLRDYQPKRTLLIWHQRPESGEDFEVFYTTKDNPNRKETFTFEPKQLKYELPEAVSISKVIIEPKDGIKGYTFSKDKDYYFEDNSIVWAKRPGVNEKFTVWYEVLNPISGGSKDESDEELRDRAKHRLDVVGKATADGLKYAVCEVEGVKSVKVLEKKGEVELIVNTIEEVMSPDVRRAVEYAIEDTRAAGIFVTFNPPDPKPIEISLKLQFQGEISTIRKREIEELIERAIKEYITNLDVGQDLLQVDLIRICLGFDEVINCKIVLPEQDVTINANQIAKLKLDKITFEEWG